MYYFIINPLASSGKAMSVWKTIKKILDKKNISYEAYITAYVSHASHLAIQITSKEDSDFVKTIVVLGGDGTLNEVVNGTKISSKVQFYFIPAGSGNDFAHSLRLPTHPKNALRRLFMPKMIKTLDYGVLSYGVHAIKHRRFTVSCGIGYDAAVCHNLFRTKFKKVFSAIHLKKLTYIIIGLKQIFVHKRSDMYVTIDSAKKIHLKKVSFLSSHIHKYEGSGFKFAPKADPADGLLDLCIVSNVSRFRLIPILFLSVFGLHGRCKGVRFYQCKEVSITSKDYLPVHTDGETCDFQKEITICCEKKKLQILL